MKINREVLTGKITQKEVEAFLTKFPELEAWLRRKGMKTQRNYVRNFMRYLETLTLNGIAKTPQDLYNLAKDNGEYGTTHIEILEEFQTDYFDVFPENETARLFNITTTVKSFYSFKGKNYQFAKGRAEVEWERKKAKRTPKPEEVIPYIDTVPHLRNKMIVALETCSPFRLESLTFLKWKHFREVLEDKKLPHVFLKSKEMKGKGKREYRGIEQHCFLTPFAKDYVLRWKTEYEELRGVKVSLENPQSLNLPFLICLKGETKGEALSYGGLNQIYDRAKSKRFPFTLHKWRTFLNEALKKARVLKEDRDVMLGHKPESIEEAYSDLNIQRLREEFRKALKFLDPTYKEDESLAKIKAKVKELKDIDISDKEAREILDTVLMKMFKGD